MAVIEPQKQPRNVLVPVIAVVVLLLALTGIGYAIYTFIGGPTSREIKLSAADAKKIAAAGNFAPVSPGPAFPAMAPLPQASDPGATMITLDTKNATLSEVLATLSKQAGVQISGQDTGGIDSFLSGRFDFAVSNEPFWSAVGNLCKAKGMYPAPYSANNDGSIYLVRGASPNAGCPILTVGSCKLLLTGVTSRFNADLMGAHPANRQLTVSMVIYVDPKIDPYRIGPTVFIEQALDEHGTSLFRPRDPWQDQNNGGQRTKYTMNLQGILQFPTNAGQRIAHLKGYASIIIADAMETVRIKDPLKAVNLDSTVGGQTIRLQRLQKQGGSSYDAQFQADSASPAFKDWNNVPKFAKLLDAAGNQYFANTYLNSMGGKTIGLTAQFNGNGKTSEPTELDLMLPAKFRELRVPFEFTDLPLPH